MQIRARAKTIASLLFTLATFCLQAQERKQFTAADYEKAERMLGYSTAPLVSVDFNHDPRSSIFDATCTKVSGRLVKVCAWYDNEWGFSNRMLDVTLALMQAK